MIKEKLVVIGNGMAGCRAVEEVLKRDPDRYEIAIFGAEPRVNYDRIMLSPVLSGEKSSSMFGARTACAYVPRNVTECTGAHTASTFHESVLPTVL